MDKYKLKTSNILTGIVYLLLGATALWFTAEVYWVYTPFSDREGFTLGEITGILRSPADDEDGTVYSVEASYWVGLTRIDLRLPAKYFYWDGLEIGDRIAVPYSNKGFDDMNLDERRLLPFLLIITAFFSIVGVVVLINEAVKAKYFRGLILNKKYIYAEFVKSDICRGKIFAVCACEGHVYRSRGYNKRKYPFERGGTIKVYVDMEKNPDRYFVSER